MSPVAFRQLTAPVALLQACKLARLCQLLTNTTSLASLQTSALSLLRTPAHCALLSPDCRQPLSSAAGLLCPRRRRAPRWPAWFTTMGTRLAPLKASPLKASPPAAQPTCRVTCRRRSTLTAHSRKLLACRAAQCRAALRPSGKAARTAWGNRRRPVPLLPAGARRLCTARQRLAARLLCSSPRVCPSTLLLPARSCSRGRRRACRPCRPPSSLHWLPGRPQCS